MLKKRRFDNLIKKVESASNKINVMMQNKLFIAILIIIDGIRFIFSPYDSVAKMARSIIILVVLAAFSTLLKNLSTKTKDIKAILLSIVILIMGIVLYIYPDLVSAYIGLIVSLLIILDGLINILNTVKSNKLSGFSKIIIQKYNSLISNKNNKSKKERLEKINQNFNKGMERQKRRIINPLKNMINKTNKSSSLYIVANVISIILGITLLILPSVSIIFLYVGFSDLIVSMRTMNISKKIKEKLKKVIHKRSKHNKK